MFSVKGLVESVLISPFSKQPSLVSLPDIRRKENGHRVFLRNIASHVCSVVWKQGSLLSWKSTNYNLFLFKKKF
jgi:hypothetical protein